MKTIKLYIIISIIGINSSCNNLGIDQEINNIVLLESAINEKAELLNQFDDKKLNSYILISNQRIKLLESSNLSAFQKDWFCEDVYSYETVVNNIQLSMIELSKCLKNLEVCQVQLTHLRLDLVHRNISKKKYMLYFSQEQKAFGDSEKMIKKVIKNIEIQIHNFEYLEAKLSKIIKQLETK